MSNRIYDSFHKIHAEEELKKKTEHYLYDEIQKRSRQKRVFRLRLVSAFASIAVFLLAGGFSYHLYFTPNAYIDIDLNPGVELSVNRFGRIIEANPYNNDGKDILDMVNLRYTSYETAVRELLYTMDTRGYFEQDGLLSVTVQAKNSEQENDMIAQLDASVNTFLQTYHSKTATDIFSVTEEVRNCAHENNVSPAKYLAILELQQVDPTANFEDCANHSISEIHQLTRKHGRHHDDSDDSTNGSANEDQVIGEQRGNSVDDCDMEEKNTRHRSGHH